METIFFIFQIEENISLEIEEKQFMLGRIQTEANNSGQENFILRK